MCNGCNICHKVQQLMYKIPSYTLCVACQPFAGFIVCTLCVKIPLYLDDYPCIGCRTRVSGTRAIPSKEQLILQHPEYMNKPCIKCNQSDAGIYRNIQYFCTSCYSNRDNCYLCDFCFHSYIRAYKICVWCGDIMDA
jgi:hypothetical protein